MLGLAAVLCEAAGSFNTAWLTKAPVLFVGHPNPVGCAGLLDLDKPTPIFNQKIILDSVSQPATCDDSTIAPLGFPPH